jgi:mannose-6-phosphate isomerase-like protein (cupin superfamily)
MAQSKQNFTVSHRKRGDFNAAGLRSYARYRDLGIAAATDGLAHAQVIRFVPPCTDAARQLHYHDVQFQMVYVLKGWIKSEFAGHGAHTMRAGSCWLQPPGIRHRVLDYSDDCEVLEVILPAEFATVMVAPNKRAGGARRRK